MHLLKEENDASVETFSKKLFISPATVRRDLSKLEKAHQIRRVPGGDAYLSPTTVVWPISLRHNIMREEKRKLAASAAQLVDDGAFIFIDSSSTCHFLAQALKSKHNLHVCTNNILIAEALAKDQTNTVKLSSAKID